MLKRIAIGLLALVLLAGAAIWWKYLRPRPYIPAYTYAQVKLADFAAGPQGEVWFRGFHARGPQDLLQGGQNAVPEPVVGTLLLPEGASAAQPAPAMVILHGSGGDFSARSVNREKARGGGHRRLCRRYLSLPRAER
jgi:hypothetical protein